MRMALPPRRRTMARRRCHCLSYWLIMRLGGNSVAKASVPRALHQAGKGQAERSTQAQQGRRDRSRQAMSGAVLCFKRSAS